MALWSHIAGHRCGRAISARIPHITHRAQRVHHAQQSSTAGVTTASRAISATMGPGSFREISSRYTAQYHFGQSRRRSACIESRTHTCVCIAQDCGVRALWVIGMRRAGAAHQVQSRARHFGGVAVVKLLRAHRSRHESVARKTSGSARSRTRNGGARCGRTDRRSRAASCSCDTRRATRARSSTQKARQKELSSNTSFMRQLFQLRAHLDALCRCSATNRSLLSTSNLISALSTHLYGHACQQWSSQNRSARAQRGSTTQLFLLAVRVVGVVDSWRTRCCHCAPSVAAAAPSRSPSRLLSWQSAVTLAVTLDPPWGGRLLRKMHQDTGEHQIGAGHSLRIK